jgi:putative ABC transport system substrate-binding protein
MRRRKFIQLMGGAATAWPLVARAQQRTMPVIGYLNRGMSDDPASIRLVAAIRQGLNETGFVEGRTLAIEYRFAEDQYDRLTALATDLVRSQVVVIMTQGNLPALTAKAATTTIPIVFSGGFDPVDLGVVTRLNRPGGNITGVSFLANSLEPKRLGLLRVLVPRATMIGALMNPDNRSTEIQSKDLKEAARTLGIELHIEIARSERDFDPAFGNFVQQRAGALVVVTDALFASRHERLVSLAARYALPAIYSGREFVRAGGLMSYGANAMESNRQAGVYAGRILKGEKPGDLPVMLPTRFEFLINLKTAKALGLTVPDGLQVAADEVIE